ncbi:MAG: ATPase subunit of ABC transporter with duplicated ATPase domains [Bacteroidia bacterium]|jgi:ATPase subunit of ABC transporter with duplicated ATPase domains
MLSVSNVSLRFGKRVLFDEVNVKFTEGNCYGIIGANGAGKSTFLKILSGEIEPTTGDVSITNGMRMAVLKQDHFEFDEFNVLETVIMGHKTMYAIMKEKDEVYAKPDFSDADGIRASELEEKFGEMGGYTADSEAGELLNALGVPEDHHFMLMKDVPNNLKVRILLAQALFGSPGILLLDEPTNDLDVETITWLENFLAESKNIVIVVSHDRHFLDSVCTHITDIDFKKIRTYGGSYTFWYESSQLALRQQQQANKKAEDRKKELQAFIERFSANVKKSKQATSRKKMLEKLNIDDIQPSSRRYPGIILDQERDAGDQILNVSGLSLEGHFSNVSFSLYRGEKIAIISKSSLAVTNFYKVLNEELKADKGNIEWGITIQKGYLPNENEHYFTGKYNLVDWLRQYSAEKDETYIRGFLGKMLFSGEEVFKKSDVLSGGEKVRCMISKLMLAQPNFIMLDEPTNHLDLESITAFNEGLQTYKGTVMFTSHDHTFMQSIANRVIEITPNGMIDKKTDFDTYLDDPEVKERRLKLYTPSLVTH